jgi:hypothetical protein
MENLQDRGFLTEPEASRVPAPIDRPRLAAASQWTGSLGAGRRLGLDADASLSSCPQSWILSVIMYV